MGAGGTIQRKRDVVKEKKAIWTLNINDFAPKITELTFPLMRKYAQKIGAEFNIITERKFPDFPVVYEKLQIHELGRDYSWNIFFDADALIHPDLFDITNHLRKDTVLHNGRDMAGNRWRYDEYFLRDGRHWGSCNWFTIASDWCLDLWKPLDDLTLEQAVANITPVWQEQISGLIHPSHLIDDYTLSRNIAKFGLKADTLIEMKQRMNDNADYTFHLYNLPEAQKYAEMSKWLLAKGLLRFMSNY